MDFLQFLLRPEESKGAKIKTTMPEPSISYSQYSKDGLFRLFEVNLSDEDVKKFNDILHKNLQKKHIPEEMPMPSPVPIIYSHNQILNMVGVDVDGKSLMEINDLIHKNLNC